MLALLVNQLTCCWGDCHQAASNLVAHGEVILEYCDAHVERAMYREELRSGKIVKVPTLRKK